MSVEPRTGRNTNLVVRQAGGPAYFLKQASYEEDAALVAHEADVYRRLGRSALRPLLAELIHFDPSRGILVLAHVETRTDVPHLRPALAQGVGDVLGRLHGVEPELAPTTKPFALSLHRPAIDALPQLSEASLACVRLIQRAGKLGEQLDEAASAWRVDGTIHNDIRLANVRWPPSDAPARPVLVDWELASPGDTAWDVGSYLAEYVLRWAISIPIADGSDPFRHVTQAREPIERARPAVRAFWRAYVARRGVAAEGDEWLDRVTRLLGARLVMGAFERAQTAPALDMSVVGLLQLAENVMVAPRAAARVILGFS